MLTMHIRVCDKVVTLGSYDGVTHVTEHLHRGCCKCLIQ